VDPDRTLFGVVFRDGRSKSKEQTMNNDIRSQNCTRRSLLGPAGPLGILSITVACLFVAAAPATADDGVTTDRTREATPPVRDREAEQQRNRTREQARDRARERDARDQTRERTREQARDRAEDATGERPPGDLLRGPRVGTDANAPGRPLGGAGRPAGTMSRDAALAVPPRQWFAQIRAIEISDEVREAIATKMSAFSSERALYNETHGEKLRRLEAEARRLMADPDPTSRDAVAAIREQMMAIRAAAPKIEDVQKSVYELLSDDQKLEMRRRLAEIERRDRQARLEAAREARERRLREMQGDDMIGERPTRRGPDNAQRPQRPQRGQGDAERPTRRGPENAERPQRPQRGQGDAERPTRRGPENAERPQRPQRGQGDAERPTRRGAPEGAGRPQRDRQPPQRDRQPDRRDRGTNS